MLGGFCFRRIFNGNADRITRPIAHRVLHGQRRMRFLISKSQPVGKYLGCSRRALLSKNWSLSVSIFGYWTSNTEHRFLIFLRSSRWHQRKIAWTLSASTILRAEKLGAAGDELQLRACFLVATFGKPRARKRRPTTARHLRFREIYNQLKLNEANLAKIVLFEDSGSKFALQMSTCSSHIRTPNNLKKFRQA